jgi:DNA-binding response OmpR family regulator
MSTPTPDELLARRRVLVADEDPKIVQFIIQTLREDGFAVFHAYDGLAATELAFALNQVHLVVTNTKVTGMPGVELVYTLRNRLPNLPILYIANMDRSTPAIEAKLPRDVPIIREPFSAEELRAIVRDLLAGKPWALDVGRSGPQQIRNGATDTAPHMDDQGRVDEHKREPETS